jgi:actin-related protein 5
VSVKSATRKREEKRKNEKRTPPDGQNECGKNMRWVDPRGWVAIKMTFSKKELIVRIRDRAKRKAALSDRKSAAAQARMKSIANLAADDRVPKKKRKAAGGEYFAFFK